MEGVKFPVPADLQRRNIRNIIKSDFYTLLKNYGGFFVLFVRCVAMEVFNENILSDLW
jgi:hypothetical protein